MGGGGGGGGGEWPLGEKRKKEKGKREKIN